MPSLPFGMILLRYAKMVTFSCKARDLQLKDLSYGNPGNYNIKSMQLWIEAFAGFRNYIKNPKGVLS